LYGGNSKKSYIQTIKKTSRDIIKKLVNPKYDPNRSSSFRDMGQLHTKRFFLVSALSTLFLGKNKKEKVNENWRLISEECATEKNLFLII